MKDYSALSSLLGDSGDATVACIRELMRELLNVDTDASATNSKGEKALLPVNFLSCVRGTQDSEDLIHSSKGVNLVLQSTLNRVKPEKLTTGQWVSANARILFKLISEKKLSSQQLEDYLEYNQKIGDLLQIFTPSSVFLLDNNHRLAIHQKPSKCWADIDSTLEIAHLKKKDDSSGSLYVSAAAGAAKSTSSGASSGSRRTTRPCWMYNSEEGCSYGRNCRYDHVDGDRRPQRASFYEKAPRFQGSGSNAVAVPSSKGNSA